jgi:hypothetical protein
LEYFQQQKTFLGRHFKVHTSPPAVLWLQAYRIPGGAINLGGQGPVIGLQEIANFHQ